MLLIIGFFVGRWSSLLFNNGQLEPSEIVGEMSAAEKSAAALALVADDVPTDDDGDDGGDDDCDDDGGCDDDDEDDEDDDKAKKKKPKMEHIQTLTSKTSELPYECKAPASLHFARAEMEPKVSKINIKKIIKGAYNEIDAADYGDESEEDQLDLVGMYTTVLSYVQHTYGVFGSVGELGVLHGRFASCLFSTARQSEDLVVADVFHKTSKNKDTEVSGDLEKLHQSLQLYGLNDKDLLVTHKGSTKDIPIDWSEYAEFNPFRFLSIDAGRTTDLVTHDLMISACNLVKGGVIVLSNFLDPNWLEVTTSLFHFLENYDMLGLKPFLLCEGKLFMTNDIVFHTQFYDRLTQDENLYQYLDTKAPGGTLTINNDEFLVCNRQKSDNPIVDVWESFMY